jgi:hypothetical protein
MMKEAIGQPWIPASAPRSARTEGMIDPWLTTVGWGAVTPAKAGVQGQLLSRQGKVRRRRVAMRRNEPGMFLRLRGLSHEGDITHQDLSEMRWMQRGEA